MASIKFEFSQRLCCYGYPRYTGIMCQMQARLIWEKNLLKSDNIVQNIVTSYGCDEFGKFLSCAVFYVVVGKFLIYSLCTYHPSDFLLVCKYIVYK